VHVHVGRERARPFPSVPAREGHVDAMRVLIKGGADVNRRDRRFTRWTPLVHAIHKREDAAARLLLDSGAGWMQRCTAERRP